MLAMGRTLQRQRVLIEQLEATRLALAEAAVADERQRIARELHDLAGHTLAAVMLHVTGARHVLRRDLVEAEQALFDAEAVGRASMDQIRAVVAGLRTSQSGTDRALAGGADLATLVEDYRRAGLAITADIAVGVEHLDGPVGTALHRIAREAIANVGRHAPANRVDLAIEITESTDTTPAAVRLVVSDVGRAPRGCPGDGFGLVGMTERARSLGGTLHAGPTIDGWRVEAALPLATSEVP